jgi:hypothetical protein
MRLPYVSGPNNEDPASISHPPAQSALKIGMHWRRWCLLAMVLGAVILIPCGWKLRLRGFDVEDYDFVTDVREFDRIN